MHRFTSFAVMIVAGLLAGCGDEGANAESTQRASQAETTARETQQPTQQREVTLSVPDMSCPMCPITVRKALAHVDGVSEAEASLDNKQARVVFDPTRTNIDALIAAVAEAGFTATALGAADA
jgi:periplasmic mercuric ion binding protein